jgi:shikimate kinase
MCPNRQPVVSGEHLILIGLMGVGKSTVGRRCARRLARPFVDTDEVVEALAGMPVPALFATQGESTFRALETQAVADACASPVPAVIACGGGAVVDPINRRAIQSAGTVVWLQAPADVLSTRVGTGDGRPLLVDAAGAPRSRTHVAATLERLALLRESAYAAAADFVVDTVGRSADEVTNEVLRVSGVVS